VCSCRLPARRVNGITEEKRQLLPVVAMLSQLDMPAPRQPASETSFQPVKDSKQIPLDAAHPNQFVTGGAGLSDK
jgi:hypothetical protein